MPCTLCSRTPPGARYFDPGTDRGMAAGVPFCDLSWAASCSRIFGLDCFRARIHLRPVLGKEEQTIWENNIENTMENDKNGKRKPVKRNVKRKKVLEKAHQGNALPDQRRKTGRGNRTVLLVLFGLDYLLYPCTFMRNDIHTVTTEAHQDILWGTSHERSALIRRCVGRDRTKRP